MNAIMISQLNIDLILGFISPIQQIIKDLQNLQSPPSKYTNELIVVTEFYESPHNYPDNADMTHTVFVPNAIKYSLEFDP